MNVLEGVNKILKKANITRYRLSKQCDVSKETLTGIFNRGRIPTIATLEAICKRNKKVNELFIKYSFLKLYLQFNLITIQKVDFNILYKKEGRDNGHQKKLHQILQARGWSRYRLSKEIGLFESIITNIFSKGIFVLNILENNTLNRIIVFKNFCYLLQNEILSKTQKV